jgi:hypothetical protein
VPREPIVEAKVEAIARRGGNPFLEYAVPQAVIKFKQGFGRLIRSKSDYGSIMIFDRRIVDMRYGKSFLNSLPECRLVKGGEELVFQEVNRFFQEHRRGSSVARKSEEAGMGQGVIGPKQAKGKRRTKEGGTKIDK